MDRNLLDSILLSEDVVKSINDNLQSLHELIPEIKHIIGFEHHHPHHHLNVWEHTLLALKHSTNDLEIRMTLLLHDIGKPFSYQDEEVRHFRGHPQVSTKIAYTILKRLGYNEQDIERICYLIKEHDSPITKVEIDNDYEMALKKFKVQYCDALAHNPTKLEKRLKYLLDISEQLGNVQDKTQIKELVLRNDNYDKNIQ